MKVVDVRKIILQTTELPDLNPRDSVYMAPGGSFHKEDPGGYIYLGLVSHIELNMTDWLYTVEIKKEG